MSIKFFRESLKCHRCGKEIDLMTEFRDSKNKLIWEDTEFCQDCIDEVFVFDYDELLQLLNYIKEKDFNLISVHERYIMIGFDCAKDIIEEEEKEDTKLN